MRHVLGVALVWVFAGITVGETLDEQVVRLFEDGKYAEAETLAVRSVNDNLERNGPDHPDTATSLNNLAAVYRAQGEYDEAEPLHKRSLAVYEKALGPDT